MGNSMRIPHIPPILQVCCIYFRRPDSIYLLHSDKELIKIVKATILQWWKLGLQRYRLKDGAHQFKLNGLPFAKSRKTNPVHTRLLCANLLRKMLQNGWMLLGATEMSRKSDQTVWLFQRMESEEPVHEVKRIVSIATMQPNKLMVLDAPEELKENLINVAQTCIERGVDRIETTPGYKRGWQIRFNRSAWNERNGKNDKEILEYQKLFLALTQLMESEGFAYYGSVNLKGTSDTLFFLQSDEFIRNKFEGHQTLTDNQYFAMIIDQKNFLRVVNGNAEVIDKIRKVTHDHWPLGSNMEANYDGYHEFRFNGEPWWSYGESSVTSRIFLTEIFQALHRDGWAAIATVRILESQQNKGMLIFRTCEPLKMEYMCVSLNEIDKIRTINAPEDITEHVREMIHYCWEYGTKHDIERFGVPEIRLRVRPWGNSFNDAMHARYLMMQVLNRLLLLRYQLVLSADFTSQFVRSRPLDVDSWWLARVYEDPEELKRKMIELAIQQRPYLEQVLLMEELANGSIKAGSANGSMIQSIDDIDSLTQRSL